MFSKQVLSINRIKNAGLGVILEAMKTTPIIEMEKTANIEPLFERRCYKALAQIEKSQETPPLLLQKKLNSLITTRLITWKSLRH